MDVKKFTTPYPNQGEIIRFLAKAFDTKSFNKQTSKKLDDFAQDGDKHHQLANELLNTALVRPLTESLSKNTTDYIFKCTVIFLEQHLTLVKNVSLEGIPRKKALTLLIEHHFSFHLSGYLKGLYEGLGGPQPQDLLLSKSALGVTFYTVEKFIPWWKGFLETLPKEEKDKIRNWTSGKKIPTSSSLIALQEYSTSTTPGELDDWAFIKDILIISRAIDYAKQTEFGLKACISTAKHLISQYPNGNYDIGNALSKALIKHNTKYESLSKTGLTIQNLLATPKPPHSQSEFFYQLNCFEEDIKQRDPEGLSQYFLHWQNAKFHVFSNELEQAKLEYEKAFQTCLYTAGVNQEKIISEALCITAILGDRSLLLNIANQAITFGYLETPSIEIDIKRINKKSRSKSPEIEDWQAEKWKSNFSNLFPRELFFQGINPPQIPHNHGVILEPIHRPLKNKKQTTIGNEASKIKKIPTLALAAFNRDYDQFEELLSQGAEINVLNDDGESALLLAIERLNIVDHLEKPDKRFFNKLRGIQYQHSKNIINARTTKKKLTPLTSAIKTGRYEIVKQLLDWGAEVDLVGTTDDISPLYVTLSVIAKIKQPEKLIHIVTSKIKEMSNEEILAVSRHVPILQGCTAKELRQQWNYAQSQPFSKTLWETLFSCYREQWKHLNLDELRTIAKLLIDKDANPNKPRTSILKGYTPLMYATELDEASLVEHMLQNGGDPYQSYQHPDTKTDINLLTIAKKFNSRKVNHLLLSKTSDLV